MSGPRTDSPTSPAISARRSSGSASHTRTPNGRGRTTGITGVFTLPRVCGGSARASARRDDNDSVLSAPHGRVAEVRGAARIPPVHAIAHRDGGHNGRAVPSVPRARDDGGPRVELGVPRERVRARGALHLRDGDGAPGELPAAPL